MCIRGFYVHQFNLTSRSYLNSSLDRSVIAPNWALDRLKICFLMLQFSIDVFFPIWFYSVCQGWLIWKSIIIQVWVTSAISSEAWLQFIYCPGLNCVVWHGVPHFNHILTFCACGWFNYSFICSVQVLHPQNVIYDETLRQSYYREKCAEIPHSEIPHTQGAKWV